MLGNIGTFLISYAEAKYFSEYFRISLVDN